MPLPNGSILIRENGDRYFIEEKLSEGGSALIYKAKKQNSPRMFVIKEAFPIDTAEHSFFRDKNMIIRAQENDLEAKSYLELCETALSVENEIGQKLSVSNSRVIASWDTHFSYLQIGDVTYDITQNEYIIMEFYGNKAVALHEILDECSKEKCAGNSLRTGGKPSLNTIAKITLETLKALSGIHNAGYIHGDIQEGNLCFMAPFFHIGEIGDCALLDFGCAKKLDSDKTVTLSGSDVHSTPGFDSPEHYSDPVVLSPASDIYAVGCLMLRLITGNKDFSPSDNMFPWKLTGVNQIAQLGTTSAVAKEAYSILKKALQQKRELRYRDADDMLLAVAELEKHSRPPKYTLSTDIAPSEYYVPHSRDRDLQHLEEMIRCGKKPVYIWGFGGIGKSELGRAFCRMQQSKGNKAFFIRYHNSMKETICNLRFGDDPFFSSENSMIKNLDSQKQLDIVFNHNISILQEHYEGAYIVIDNFDKEDVSINELRNETEFRQLMSLSINYLITTRSRPDETTQELGPLSETDLIALFNSCCSNCSASKEEILDLIHLIDGHPLTVELAARAIASRWTPLSFKDVYDRIKAGQYDDHSLAEVKSDKDRHFYEGKIAEHIKMLFNISNLSEGEKQVLLHAAMVPTDCIDVRRLLLSEPENMRMMLKHLEEQSWIRNNGVTIYVHPIIQQLALNSIRLDLNTAAPLFEHLWSWFLDCCNGRDDFPNKEKGILAKCSTAYSLGNFYYQADLNTHDETGSLLQKAGICYYVAEDIDSSLRDVVHDCLNEAILLESSAQSKKAELALSHSVIGLYYSEMLSMHAFSNDALELQGMDISYWFIGPPKLTEMFNSFVGNEANPRKVAYSLPISHLMKAVEMLEDSDLHNNSLLLINYNNLSYLLQITGSNQDAKPIVEKQLKLLTEFHEEDQEQIAICRSAYARILYELHSYSDALHQQLLACKYFFDKQIMIEESHIALAVIYRALGQWSEAIKHMESALAFSQKNAEDKGIPSSFNVYFNMDKIAFLAEVYEQIGDADTALEKCEFLLTNMKKLDKVFGAIPKNKYFDLTAQIETLSKKSTQITSGANSSNPRSAFYEHYSTKNLPMWTFERSVLTGESRYQELTLEEHALLKKAKAERDFMFPTPDFIHLNN